MIKTTIDKVQEIFIEKGYDWLDDGFSYKLNIVGVRNPDKESNEFNDTLIVVYRDEKFNSQIKIYPFTTDPGTYWLNNPMNPKGTAIVVEGQYLNLWDIGLHKGYEAFVQVGEIEVYRNNNNKEKGIIGINCHRSNPYTESTLVKKSSAGCQVHKAVKNHLEVMEIARISKLKYNKLFNYTLINEKDFKEIPS